MVTAWSAAEPGAVPDGAPPWLVALGILAGLAGTVLPVYLARRSRRDAEPEEKPADTTGTATAPPLPPGIPPTLPPGLPQGPLAERADAAMDLLAQMLERVERDQERDRAQLERLQEQNLGLATRVAQLEADVSSRDQTIQRLHAMLDEQRARPRWTPPGQHRTPGH